LGHKSVESTQIYTHTTEEKKRAAVMRVLGKGAA
jgi:site-specific recombinase XerD